MQLVGTSVNLVIDAKTKSTANIIQIVSSIGLKESHITIKNANSKSTLDLIQIARVYPDKITYDFTDNNA